MTPQFKRLMRQQQAASAARTRFLAEHRMRPVDLVEAQREADRIRLEGGRRAAQ